MKRFHVHTHVADLDKSIAFYSKLFGAEPSRAESDYAKWMLEDPRINFAISTRGSKPGVDHLGIQTDTAEELVELRARAQAADMALLDAGETTCCYARSEKYWITDPQGVAWEQFHTLADIPVFSESLSPESSQATACCPGDAPRANSANQAVSQPVSQPVDEPVSKPARKPVGIPVRSSSSCC